MISTLYRSHSKSARKPTLFMGTEAETLPIEEFVERYRRLAGHIAWTFVRRSHREISPVVLTQEDAEDFASCALLKLVKCPPQFRDQKPYVNLLIVNGIITAWRKRLKQLESETNGKGAEDGEDYFDTIEGRDGVHTSTQTKFDFRTVSNLLPNLPAAERLVIELNFGLGCPPCGVERIGKKLGRSKSWVELRISKGILRIRESLSSQQQSLPV